MSPPKNNKLDLVLPVILSAGKGTRFKSSSKTVPKALIRIKGLNDQPIIKLILDSLIQAGFTIVIIVVGYRKNEINSYIIDYKKTIAKKRINIIIIDSEDNYKFGPLHSFLSIMKNPEIFEKLHSFLIFPSDTIFEIKFYTFLTNFIQLNLDEICKYPFLFYKSVTYSKIENYKRSLIDKHKVKLAVIETNNEKQEELKSLSYIDIENIHNSKLNKEVKLIYPTFLVPSYLIEKFSDQLQKSNLKTIREFINYLLDRNFGIKTKNTNRNYIFFDIDTEQDLIKINKKLKKVDNRFH